MLDPIQVSSFKVNDHHLLRLGVKLLFFMDADVSVPRGSAKLVLFYYQVLREWYRARPIVFKAFWYDNVKILQHTERMRVFIIQLLLANLAKPVPDRKEGQ